MEIKTTCTTTCQRYLLIAKSALNTTFFKKIIYFYLFYLWLCWVFVSVQGLSLVAASGGHSSLRCVGLLLSRPLLLRSTGSRRAGSVIVAHGPSCMWDLPRPGLEPVSPALRQILNHCATREAPKQYFFFF